MQSIKTTLREGGCYSQGVLVLPPQGAKHLSLGATTTCTCLYGSQVLYQLLWVGRS